MKYIEIPNTVNNILKLLSSYGHTGYVVGGCVRDCIMGRQPHDWDICTSALPEEIMTLFRGQGFTVVPTGIQHGTVTVFIDTVGYEITTYRIDQDYEDHRHPTEVKFTRSLEEDLSRRDFTINAIAYNSDVGLVDLFNGVQDIHDGIIRCVGCAQDRFSEDALRIMRAIRFASQFDFTYDTSVISGIARNKHLLDFISKERIHDELIKILQSTNASVHICMFAEVFKQIIPELSDMFDFPQNNPYHVYDVWNHTIHVLQYAESYDIVTKLAALFHDIGKPHCYQDGNDGVRHFKGHGRVSADITDHILRNLRFDNKTREAVVQLVYYHDATFEVGTKYVNRWINKIGKDQFIRLLDLRESDIEGQGPLNREARIEKIQKIRDILSAIENAPQCFSVKDLAINGYDLMSVGYSPGKQIGSALNVCLSKVLDQEIDNNRDCLLSLCQDLLVSE